MNYEEKKASLLKQKLFVDERLAALKIKKHKATMLAFTRGIYMEQKRFSQLESRIEQLKIESQQIQIQLSMLKMERKANHETAHEETRRGAITPGRVKASASR